MRAIVLKEPGRFTLSQDVATPEVAADEVLVKVKAISINPVDVKTGQGKAFYGQLKEQDPLIMGWDIAGEVVDAGAGVTTFKAGDAVFGMVNFPGNGKAYAEYVAAPAAHLALKPANVSFEEAAAATLAALTAWQALVVHGQVKAGQKVLVHAAGGGVGHYAVQLAKQLGAFVVATSSAAKKDFVMSLGADEHIDYTQQRFEQVVTDADMVLDSLGAENVSRSLDAVKQDGIVVSILGFSDENKQKAQERGVRGMAFLVSANGEHMAELAQLLEAGKLRSHVSQTVAFEHLQEAHQQVESGKTAGKVVVVL